MKEEDTQRLHAAILLCIAEQKLADLGLQNMKEEMAEKVDQLLNDISND